MRASASGPARKIATTGAAVTVSDAAAPSAGQVLTATGPESANWQTPGGSGADLIVRTVSATGSALETDDVILLDAGGGSFTFTIPSPVARSGRPLTLIRVNTGANAPTVVAAEGTIYGAASWSPLVARESIDVVADGASDWRAR